MLFTVILIYIPIHLLLGVLAYTQIMKMYKFYNTQYPHLQNLPQQYKAFIRQDQHKWDKRQILIGSFLRFPIKLLLWASFMSSLCLIIKVFGQQLSNKIIHYYGRYYGKFMYRFLWNIKQPQGINHVNVKTPLLISNHVCWIDTMYLLATFYPISFVAKQQVKKDMFFGTITANVKSIFVQRSQQSARDKIVHDIKQRITLFNQQTKQRVKNQIYPVIIFPQGTNSNGKSLLKFKLGAFNDLAPITIIALKYTSDKFDAGMVQVTPIQHLFLGLTFKINLQVEMSQISANPGQTPQDYCKRAQQKLSKMTGFKIYKVGYRQRKQHENQVKQILKKNKQTMKNDKKQQ